MVTRYEIETQCDFDTFMSHLPEAIQHRPYVVDGMSVKIYDGMKEIRLSIGGTENRQLGKLTLPMERVVFEFPDHSDDEAEMFISSYRAHTQRMGGG